MHMRVGLDAHVLIDAHRSADAHPAQVVALQVDQHHVLGALLLIVQQRPDQRGVGLRAWRRAAGCRRSDAWRRYCRESTPGARARNSAAQNRRGAAAPRTDWDWLPAGAGRPARDRPADAALPATRATDWPDRRRPRRCTRAPGAPAPRNLCGSSSSTSELRMRARPAPDASPRSAFRNSSSSLFVSGLGHEPRLTGRAIANPCRRRADRQRDHRIGAARQPQARLDFRRPAHSPGTAASRR